MVIQLHVVQELDTLLEAHWSTLGFCTRYQLRIVTFYIVYLMFMSLASVVVKVIDSHLCDLGSSPGQGNHIIRYSLINNQFISDESSPKLVLYLC